MSQFPPQLQNEGEIVIAQLLKKDRAYVLAHPERVLTPTILRTARRHLEKLLTGVPLAYLTGHKEFFGLDFFVNRNVLVPRPDTEILVDEAINLIDNTNVPVILIDVGTGSGCIPIAIKKTLQHKNIETHAIDISKRALRVAKKNAKKYNKKITFHQGDLLIPTTMSKILNPKSEIVVTANLPYLTGKQFAEEKSIQKEPKLALVADNKNGLSLYEKLLKQLQSLIFNFQYSAALLLEIDPDQTADIYELIKNIFPSARIEIKKDLASRDRLVIVQLSTSAATPSGTI